MLAMDDMEAWMSSAHVPGPRSASRHASVTSIVCHVVRLTRSLRALDLRTLVEFVLLLAFSSSVSHFLSGNSHI